MFKIVSLFRYLKHINKLKYIYIIYSIVEKLIYNTVKRHNKLSDPIFSTHIAIPHLHKIVMRWKRENNIDWKNDG